MYQSAKPKIIAIRPATLGDWVQSRTILWAIMALAVLLRVAAALYLGNRVEVLPGIHDQISYHALAQRVLGGFGFSFAEVHWPITQPGEPTAHWSFLYTLYLAAVYAVSGVTPLAARLLQAVVAGLLHPWLAYRLGRRLFGPATGLWAALLTAVYLYFVYYAGALMTETFYIMGILWCLDLALRIGKSQTGGSVSAWLTLGLALGITLLLRQVFMLFVPFLFLWLFWQIGCRNPLRSQVAWRRAIKGTVICGAVTACLILPWTARNYAVFGQFVPLNTNSGYAFFWGNHPIYGTNFPGVLPDDGPTYQSLIPPELWRLNEAELDSALLRRGIGFVQDDPRRYVLLSLSRVREYFKFWPSPGSSQLSNISRVASFGLLLPIIIGGLVLTIWRVRPASTRLAHGGRARGGLDSSGLVLVALFVFVYTGAHLLTWTLVRYRLPVDAVLLLFAAYALASFYPALIVLNRPLPTGLHRHNAPPVRKQ